MSSAARSRDAFVGVCDIGGTQLRVALADRAGNLITRRAMPHLTRDPDAVISRIANELLSLAQKYGVTLQGIGASVPGPLDAARGVILFSPNLGWRDVAFTEALAARMQVPIALDDDANCAALGEQWRDGIAGGNSARDMVYIIVGTGIGSGLILDGKLYRGATGGAGEIGHTTIEPNGPLCSCGNRGCLEVLAAGPALLRRAHDLGLTCLTTSEVIAQARGGDTKALQMVQEAGRYLGIGLANVVNLLNPELIVIGGGVALDARELLLLTAREEMARHALAASADHVRIELARLGDHAGLIGAARLAWEKLETGD